jgi:hypothetical protein
MKLSKFILFLTIITAVSLLYVWQQTEVVCLAYEGQKQAVHFQELLDVNSTLRYNLTKNTSLVNIGNSFTSGRDFKMPKKFCLVKVSSPSRNSKYAKAKRPKDMNILSQVFGIRRQAEAKTLNPSFIITSQAAKSD